MVVLLFGYLIVGLVFVAYLDSYLYNFFKEDYSWKLREFIVTLLIWPVSLIILVCLHSSKIDKNPK